ncbi:MAG: hypothetical protein DRP71_04630 [Verrucomicrobia bacterium]|nr:MAG: hypothetical protein DRP71_04630 [Verrucomicrobiota bacterium]
MHLGITALNFRMGSSHHDDPVDQHRNLYQPFTQTDVSREIALANIQLEPCARWARTEYSLDYHPEFLATATGLTPDDDHLQSAGHDALGLDFIWRTHNGMIDWAASGRTTDMGHAAYAVDASDQRQDRASPFASEEEVWAYDAVEEYGLPDFSEQVASYQELQDEALRKFPGQLTTGGYYRTIISGAIEAFGWDMLLMGASDPDRFEKVLDSFFRRTLFFMRAWAETTTEVIIQHDDFVWASGPFLDPEYYRRVIIPRYAVLWKPLHAAGKKVLFCSDGDFTPFVDNLVEAGADGFIFEPCMDFGRMVERYGRTHCLAGSYVDCRDLAAGKWEVVSNAIDRTFEALKGARGALFAVGNHLAPNIPDEILMRYFDSVRNGLRRPSS